MRFLAIFLALFSLNAFADAPLIWNSGSLGKFLSTRGFLLNDGKEYSSQTASPISTPHAAPIGSVVVSSLAGVGHLYLKTGSSDNSWTDLNSSGAYLPLAGGTLSGSLGMASNYITGVLNPVNVLDAANKQYVDGLTADAGVFAKLLGRSGGQVLNGGTAASDTLTLRSTTNGTVGKVIIADQTSEKFQVGPAGSFSTFNNPYNVLLPNTSSINNGLVIAENSVEWPSTLNGIGPKGFQFIPTSGGEPQIVIRSASDSAKIHVYRSTDGSDLGYETLGLPWGFANNNAGLTTARISGSNGQAVDILQYSNQTGFANIVSSIGKDGQFRAPAGTAALPGQSFHGINGDGMYDIASGSLGFATAGAHRAALNSTGLGVGVTNPTTMLDVGGNARIQGLTIAGPVVSDALGNLSSLAKLTTAMIPSLSFTDILGGVSNAQLPTPQAGSLGGVKSIAHVVGKLLSYIGTDGGPVLDNVSFTDILGGVSNAQLPTPQSGSLGGIKSLAKVTSKWLDSISTSGTPSASQPNFNDIAGGVANSQMPSPQSGSLGGVNSSLAIANRFLTGIRADGSIISELPTFANISGSLGFAQGGTNAVSAAEALLNLLPSQAAGSSGKYLQSNFPNPPTWTTPAGGGGGGTLYAWAGHFDVGSFWDYTATSISNPAINNSTTLTQDYNDNFGSVSVYNSGGNLPGITFTCPATKHYIVHFTGDAGGSPTGDFTFDISDLTPTVIAQIGARVNAVSEDNNMSMTGTFSCTSGNSTTLRIRGSVSTGQTIEINARGRSMVRFDIHSVN